MATSPTMINAIAAATMTKKVIMAPDPRLAASQAWKKRSKAAEKFFLLQLLRHFAATWLLPSFMTKPISALLTSPVMTRENSGDYLNGCRRIQGQKRIYAYVAAVDYLLNSYPNNNIDPKVSDKFETFKHCSG